jgi:hypothetical protein
MIEFVTPAKVTEGNAEPGVQCLSIRQNWIPAFAGMTVISLPHQRKDTHGQHVE